LLGRKKDIINFYLLSKGEGRKERSRATSLKPQLSGGKRNYEEIGGKGEREAAEVAPQKKKRKESRKDHSTTNSKNDNAFSWYEGGGRKSVRKKGTSEMERGFPTNCGSDNKTIEKNHKGRSRQESEEVILHTER